MPMLDTTHAWPLALCLKLQVIYGLWLPLLGLTAHGKDQAALQGWLLPALGLVVGHQMSQGTPRFTVTCLHPPVAFQAQSLKEPLWNWQDGASESSCERKVSFRLLGRWGL